MRRAGLTPAKTAKLGSTLLLNPPEITDGSRNDLRTGQKQLTFGVSLSINIRWADVGRTNPEKHPWDMPTSQLNSIRETWILADIPGVIALSVSESAEISGQPCETRL